MAEKITLAAQTTVNGFKEAAHLVGNCAYLAKKVFLFMI